MLNERTELLWCNPSWVYKLYPEEAMGNNGH